ncbi:hypothetical protein K440DRAFT_373724 [Wilcoxina mikolae CBS 423.85]|nr:hypothetical protein K440DRAFT_373724 [Wilcoxina mikolae CBS 423.85]
MSALEEMPEALETEFSELDIDSNGLETRAVKSYDREIDSEQNMIVTVAEIMTMGVIMMEVVIGMTPMRRMIKGP